MFNTAIIAKRHFIDPSYIHVHVDADEKGNIMPVSLEYVRRKHGIEASDIIWLHTFSDHDDAVFHQRAFDAVFKLAYVAGRGHISSSALTDEIVISVADKLIDATAVDVANLFVKYKDLFAEASEDKNGLLYVMLDYDRNGKAYYKIGESNIKKAPEGRLRELIAAGYISTRAKVFGAWCSFSKHTGQSLEGYWHARFIEAKISAPYRANDSNGQREKQDECYRLTDSQIRYMTQQMDTFFQRVRHT